MFHPVSKRMLQFIPAANIAGTLDGYNASGVNDVNRNQYLLKIDQRVFAEQQPFRALGAADQRQLRSVSVCAQFLSWLRA